MSITKTYPAINRQINEIKHLFYNDITKIITSYIENEIIMCTNESSKTIYLFEYIFHYSFRYRNKYQLGLTSNNNIKCVYIKSNNIKISEICVGTCFLNFILKYFNRRPLFEQEQYFIYKETDEKTIEQYDFLQDKLCFHESSKHKLNSFDISIIVINNIDEFLEILEILRLFLFF